MLILVVYICLSYCSAHTCFRLSFGCWVYFFPLSLSSILCSAHFYFPCFISSIMCIVVCLFPFVVNHVRILLFIILCWLLCVVLVVVIGLFLFIITTVDILFPFVCCVLFPSCFHGGAHTFLYSFLCWCGGFVVESVWVLLFSFCLLGSDSAASVFAAISVVAYS